MSRRDWGGWAEEHGLTFSDEAPDLVGTWLPRFEGDEERYRDVVAGEWRSFDFTAFSYGTLNRRRFGQGRWTDNGYLFLRLPGALPPEIAAMQPADAFALLGGQMTTAFDFTFRPPDRLAGITTSMTPQLLEGALQNLTVQLEAAPADLWLR